MSEQWVLVLDEYEAVNLAAVLRHIKDHPASQHLNTGDWVYQLLWKMPSELHHGPGQGLQPNPIELLGEDTECDHEWVDARNEVVTSGEWCRKCNAVRAGNEEDTE